MNWVFWILVILAIVFIWAAAAALFKPIGILFSSLIDEVDMHLNEKESED